jgi:hypothetical protein
MAFAFTWLQYRNKPITTVAFVSGLAGWGRSRRQHRCPRLASRYSAGSSRHRLSRQTESDFAIELRHNGKLEPSGTLKADDRRSDYPCNRRSTRTQRTFSPVSLVSTHCRAEALRWPPRSGSVVVAVRYSMIGAKGRAR